MAGWSNQKTQGGRENKPRIYEQMDNYEFPPNKWITVRPIGPIWSYAGPWIKVMKKDGTVSGAFPKICLDYNPKTQDFDRITKKDKKTGKRKVVAVCPYRKGGLYIAQKFIENFIIRELQKAEPKRKGKPTKSESKPQEMCGEKFHIKEMGSDTWTPCRVIPMPTTLAEQMGSLEELNVHGGKAYPLNDPRRGMDVKIRFNPKAAGSAKWQVQVGKQTRLTEEELAYHLYKLDVSSLEPETEEEANKNWEALKDRIVTEENKDDKKKKKKNKDSDDDDDDDSDLEENNKKKKKSSKARKETRAGKSSKKSSKSSKSSGKKKRSMNNLDDFDV